jgi:hypothetical protein
MSFGQEPGREQALVARCLQGEARAWREFVDVYRNGLRWAVQQHLAHWGCRDSGLRDDFLQVVFLGLIVNNGARLRRWDSKRGRLATFLAALAQREINAFFRARRRARRCQLALLEDLEQAWIDRRDQSDESDVFSPLPQGFWDLLTSRERSFLTELRRGRLRELKTSFPRTNFWKMAQRIRRKWDTLPRDAQK